MEKDVFHDQKRRRYRVCNLFSVHFRTMMSDDAHKRPSTDSFNSLRISALLFWHGSCYIIIGEEYPQDPPPTPPSMEGSSLTPNPSPRRGGNMEGRNTIIKHLIIYHYGKENIKSNTITPLHRGRGWGWVYLPTYHPHEGLHGTVPAGPHHLAQRHCHHQPLPLSRVDHRPLDAGPRQDVHPLRPLCRRVQYKRGSACFGLESQ